MRNPVNVNMFIEIHIDGLDQPHIVEVGKKANALVSALETQGKSFRLGKVSS